MYLPIAIHHEPGSAYGVTIPDVPGAFSAGDTLEEAMSNAKEAVLFHVEELLKDNEFKGVTPSAIETLQADEAYAGAVWALIEVDLDKYSLRQTRFNVSWPEYLLAKVDEYASARHETRSGFLARAAQSAME